MARQVERNDAVTLGLKRRHYLLPAPPPDPRTVDEHVRRHDRDCIAFDLEEIADAAAISPRTFLRYFPSKEDGVLWDEYDDPSASDLIDARPPDSRSAKPSAPSYSRPSPACTAPIRSDSSRV
jgi:hypothetical protein